jgi:hypothetical protein
MDLFICAKDLFIGAKVETPATRGYVPGRGPLALRCGDNPHRRAERPLGRFAPRPGFICAKTLLVETKAPQAPTPKPFDLDQNFEPSARNRRPTAIGAALKMSGSAPCLMSLTAQMQARRPPWSTR